MAEIIPHLMFVNALLLAFGFLMGVWSFSGQCIPYRNENVAALELQYCGSRAAIKF